MDSLKLENQLCFPLYAAARKVVGAYTPYLKPLGITYTQYITFMVLWEQDGIPVGDIGDRLFLDNGTLTPLLKKMEKQGFVKRKRNPQDERQVLIYLTNQGKAMKDQVIEIPQKIGSCFPIKKNQAKELYDILYTILEGDACESK